MQYLSLANKCDCVEAVLDVLSFAVSSKQPTAAVSHIVHLAAAVLCRMLHRQWSQGQQQQQQLLSVPAGICELGAQRIQLRAQLRAVFELYATTARRFSTPVRFQMERVLVRLYSMGALQASGSIRTRGMDGIPASAMAHSDSTSDDIGASATGSPASAGANASAGASSASCVSSSASNAFSDDDVTTAAGAGRGGAAAGEGGGRSARLNAVLEACCATWGQQQSLRHLHKMKFSRTGLGKRSKGCFVLAAEAEAALEKGRGHTKAPEIAMSDCEGDRGVGNAEDDGQEDPGQTQQSDPASGLGLMSGGADCDADCDGDVCDETSAEEQLPPRKIARLS